MSTEIALTTSGGIAILPNDDRIIDYEFPPTNYQAAPVPTEDTEDIGAAVAISMTAAERTAITPIPGELIWDTTYNTLFVGDGITPGGTAVEGGGSSGGDFTSVTYWESSTVEG